MIGSDWNQLRLLSVLCLLITLGYGRDTEQPSSPIRGTINVVLANKNGIVAVTDSMQSYRDPASGTFKQLPEPGRKLFRLDDKTICTIAGFGSVPVPAIPEITSSSIGILQLYKENSQNTVQTFDTNFVNLGYLFKLHLETIADVLNTYPPGDYRFQLLMAGFDNDGTPKIGKLMLGMTVQRNGIFSSVDEMSEIQIVASHFAYYLAGQPDVARLILENPALRPNAPIVRKYAQARDSLSLGELKELALFLSHETAIGNPTVGGEDQIAVLSDRKVQSVQQPTFAQPIAGSTFSLAVDTGDIGGEGELITMPGMILIHSTVQNKARYPLDGKSFFRSEFLDSRLHYDGGLLRLDSSNSISRCVLVLGPNAKNNPQRVADLRRRFQWVRVEQENGDAH